MLRTRLWMGAVLIVLTLGVLVLDSWFAPWFPCLFVLVVGLGVLGCFELLHLLPPARRPPGWLCYTAVMALAGAGWLPHVVPTGDTCCAADGHPELAGAGWLPHVVPTLGPDPWRWVCGVFAAVVLAAFLAEMAVFHEPGESVVRVALTIWAVAYLGLLPGFLAQLRWLTDLEKGANLGALALALAIFVPKVCDIGAYFTGRFLGKHRMAPVLSPKKTWEGAAGGLTASVLAAIGIATWWPVVPGGVWGAAAFGLSVGLAGMLGDLAESLIKRDLGHKDASQVVPGFGGVLDVVDAILFAAPVSYWWLAQQSAVSQSG